MKELDDELSPREREAFDALSRDAAPPEFLEERVVNQLKTTGLIRSAKIWRHRPGIRIGSALAASVAVFVLGAVVGLRWRATPSGDQNSAQFMLVLRESAQELQTESPERIAQAIREYSGWAKNLQQDGLLVEGEKLKDEMRFLDLINGKPTVSATQPAGRETVTGFFLIRAPDYRKALSIAESCPHLAYGGVIEIRQIDLTSDETN
jgi:hypothetical protein